MSPRLRIACLRLFALLSLLFATAATQELLLLTAEADCCADDAHAGGECAPASCQVCPCCHFSAVLTAPAAVARLAKGPPTAPALEPVGLESFDYREPPFRPPAG